MPAAGFNTLISRIRLLQKDHLRLQMLLLFGTLWIFSVLTVSDLISRSIEAGQSSFSVSETLPQQSDVEETERGNCVTSAVLARRIPLVRYNSRGERRYGGTAPAAPRFYTSYALPVELLSADMLLPGVRSSGAGETSFLLEVCLKSSTPVRAGPIGGIGVFAAGAAVC